MTDDNTPNEGKHPMATANTPVPDDVLDLEMDALPLPPWARNAVDMLDGATSRSEIAKIIEPIRAQSEGAGKAAVRAALAAAQARCTAPVAPTPLTVLALVWARLWGSFGAALGQPGALAFFGRPVAAPAPVAVAAPTPAPVAAALAPVAQPAPLAARWIPAGGGAFHALTTGPATVGSRLRVTTKGGRVSYQIVTAVVTTRANGERACVVVPESEYVGSASPVSPTPAVSLPSESGYLAALAQSAGYVAAPVEIAAESAQEPTSSGSTLIGDLTGIATEGASNAAGTTLGSMAGGQLRGVGFSTAQGYVTALAHGVKQATAESYKSILRRAYHYTQAQIDALTVTIIPESTLPVGVGITHTPSVNAMDMTAAQRRALWKTTATPTAQNATEIARAETRAAETRSDEMRSMLIAGLVADGMGIVIAPGDAHRGVSQERAPLVAALTEAGFRDLAPGVKSNKAQFGAVMQTLNGGGLRTRAAKKKHATAWPADVASRWIVDRPNDAAVLGSAGDKELIAELTADDEIRFVGGTTELRERVVAAFDERIDGERYTASDLLGWLKRKLHNEFYAVKSDGFIYCPGSDEHCTKIRNFVNAALPFLGRGIGVGELASKAGMADGIARTLSAEIAAVRKAYENNKADAGKAAARKALESCLGTAEQELAARRADASPEAAANRVKDLSKVAARVEGFRELIGPKAHAPLKVAVDELRALLNSLCDFVELDLD
jgi:hypothetical protein